LDDLIVDVDRAADPELSESTGIFVRAKLGDKWGSWDIAQLTKGSLLSWLKSRGGDNPYAEDVVGILLGYGHLHQH